MTEYVQRERTGATGLGVFVVSLQLGFEKQLEPALSYDLDGTEVSKILAPYQPDQTFLDFRIYCLAAD